MKVKLLGLVVSVCLLSAFSIDNLLSWQISEDYSIRFSNSKAKGHFTDFAGTIEYNEENLADSHFDIEIAVSSIKTGNFLKNNHAKGDKWFDAKQYPTIDFTSKEFRKTASGHEVDGILLMHGIEKEVTLPFTFQDNIFAGSFSVDRTDFGIGSTQGLAKKVPHVIDVTVSVPVTR